MRAAARRKSVATLTGMGEAAAVWTLYGAVVVADLVTYAREPPGLLYHVSDTGLRGGASRAVIALNWSTAAAALAIAGLAAVALLGASRAFALAAVPLCATMFVPGVVRQAHLEARPVNAIPAAGVFLAAVATVVAARRVGLSWARRRPFDAVRAVVAVVLVLGALPWTAALLGFSLAGVPILGTLFQTGELRTEPGDPVPRPAVHLGDHHGLQGILLALTALALSRRLDAAGWPLRVYVAFLFGFGVVNAVQDFWLEQVVKRGWTGVGIPSVLSANP